MRLLPFYMALVLMASCGGSSEPPPPTPPPPSPKVIETKRDDRPVIVAFGDSLSAGFGLESGQSYPDQLQRVLDEKGYGYRVVNQGLSGDTTSGGVSRLPQVLAQKPKIVIVELGGNDGLRGLPVTMTRDNLDQILTALKAAGIKPVLAGITLPRNYGPDYIRDFDRIYPDLAKKHNVPRIRFLLEGVATVKGMMLEDQIHPTAEGARKVARDNVFPVLEPLLEKPKP